MTSSDRFRHRVGAIAELLAGSGTPTHSILQSRIGLLLTGDCERTRQEEFAFSDKEDGESCLLTASVTMAGLVLFLGLGHLSMAGSISLEKLWLLPVPESYAGYLGWLVLTCLLGIAFSFFTMFLASRNPEMGFVLAAAIFASTMAFLGVLFSPVIWLATFIGCIAIGGMLCWAYLLPSNGYRQLLVIVSLLILCSTIWMVMAAPEQVLDATFERLTWPVRIILLWGFLIAVIAYSIVLGEILQALTSASSKEVSPFTTSSYALCLMSAALWVVPLYFVILAITRSRSNQSH